MLLSSELSSSVLALYRGASLPTVGSIPKRSCLKHLSWMTTLASRQRTDDYLPGQCYLYHNECCPLVDIRSSVFTLYIGASLPTVGSTPKRNCLKHRSPC